MALAHTQGAIGRQGLPDTVSKKVKTKDFPQVLQ